MNKLIRLAALYVVVHAPVFAGDTHARAVEPAFNYNQVKMLFRHGSAPTQKDLAGWHAGRWFDRSEEYASRAIPTLLVGKGDQLYVLSDYDADAGEYDNMTLDQRAAQEELMIQLRDYFTAPVFGERGVTFTEIDSDRPGGKGTSYELRKAGPWLILRAEDVRVMYGVYFKNVTPDDPLP